MTSKIPVPGAKGSPKSMIPSALSITSGELFGSLRAVLDQIAELLRRLRFAAPYPPHAEDVGINA